MGSRFKYCDDVVKLYQYDCVDLIRSIDYSVDLVYADPPYFNRSTYYQSSVVFGKIPVKLDYDDVRSPLLFHILWISAVSRILKHDGGLLISCSLNGIPSIVSALEICGYYVRQEIVWSKKNPMPCLSKQYLTHSSEYILVCCKIGCTPYFDYEASKTFNKGKQLLSVWNDISIPHGDEVKYGKHPNQKPVELLERLILIYSAYNELVLDPFCGVGSSLMASINLSRRYIGIDINRDYLSIALQRYSDIAE